MTTLFVREDGNYREASFEHVMTRAHQLIAQRFRRGAPVLRTPALTREFLHIHLAGRDSEMFGVLHLDTRGRLIRAEDLFAGTIDGAVVHPREVVRSALQHNAARIICYHNHPSGEATPSENDCLITCRLKEALALVDIRLIDHLIVGATTYSFADAGRL